MNKLVFVVAFLFLCVSMISVEQMDSSNIKIVTNSDYWHDVVEEHEPMEDLEYEYIDLEYEVDWIPFIMLVGLFAFFFFMLMLRRRKIKFRIKKPDIVINMIRRKSSKRPIAIELKNGKKIKVYR